MNPTLLDELSQVERHVREGERHLLHQREIVAELERHGRGNSQTAKMARELLKTFELVQSKHLNYRARLLLRAVKQPAAPTPVAERR